jgi:hypothetical protein
MHARMRAAVEGIDQGAGFAESTSLLGHRGIGGGHGDRGRYHHLTARFNAADEMIAPREACRLVRLGSPDTVR